MTDLPKDVEALIEKADSLARKKDWGAAVRVCTKLLDLLGKQPSSVDTKARVYYNRGIGYNSIGEHDRAIADFDKALEISPHYAKAYNNRGNAYYDKGEYDRAITDFDKALEISPDYANAYSNRGNAYHAKGEYDRAIFDFDKALEISPDHVSAYNNRGNAYHAKGEYDRAIADFDKALEISPNDASTYNNRGTVYAARKDYDRAIADYERALNIDPKYLEAIHNRSLATSAKYFDAKLEQQRADFEHNFLAIKGYKSREEKYQREANKIGAIMTAVFVLLQLYAASAFLFVAHIAWRTLHEEINALTIFPLITAASLCAVPFIWYIRTLKQEKSRVMALSQDAYTKGMLANLVGVNIAPEIQKDLLRKFFDHHAQHGSAQLIVDLETGAKTDGDGNPIIQTIKESLPDGKKE